MTHIARHILALALIITPATLSVWAQATQRLEMQDTLQADQLLTVAWNNPAVMQLARSTSTSSVGGAWTVSDQNDNDSDRPMLDVQQGDYSRVWTLGARTHIKHGGSTLWGHANYENGFTRGMSWNETSDLDMVYPYVLADSVTSSRLKMERYSFGGGYADNNGNLYWGATIDYTAGLHYRSVDPRPRNVISDLNISAGIGKVVRGTHVAAVALHFKKYKQTNNVAFYSELGHDKIFHLTGLTNDYGRFAGTGEASYYNGYRWGATANLHPVMQQGLTLAVTASRLAFDNILTTLNELPLAHVTHNAITGELGWLSRNWGVRGVINASRRVGTENVFGDAASAVYPQIGSNDMYHENRFGLLVDGSWSRQLSPQLLTTVHPFVAYNHRNQIYADPQCQWQLNDVTWGTRLHAATSMGRFMPALSLGATMVNLVDSRFMVNQVKDELQGLLRAQEATFDYVSHFNWRFDALLSLQVAVKGRQAIHLDAGSQWAFYRHSLTVWQPQLSLAYLF